MSWPRAIAGWLVLVVLMVLNGIARQALLATVLSPLRAHQVSSIAGIGIILAASWLLVPWVGARSVRQQLRLGFAWVVGTVAFEFVFGHWAVGHSWRHLAADYDLLAGRLWPLVLLATGLAPRFIGALRERRAA